MDLDPAARHAIEELAEQWRADPATGSARVLQLMDLVRAEQLAGRLGADAGPGVVFAVAQYANGDVGALNLDDLAPQRVDGVRLSPGRAPNYPTIC